MYILGQKWKLNFLIGQLQELELHYFNVFQTALLFLILVNMKIFAILIHVELMYEKKKEMEKNFKNNY